MLHNFVLGINVDIQENKPSNEHDIMKTKTLKLIKLVNEQNRKISEKLPKPFVVSQ